MTAFSIALIIMIFPTLEKWLSLHKQKIISEVIT